MTGKYNTQLQLTTVGGSTIFVRSHSGLFKKFEEDQKIDIRKNEILKVVLQGVKAPTATADYVGAWALRGKVSLTLAIDKTSGLKISLARVSRIELPEETS